MNSSDAKVNQLVSEIWECALKNDVCAILHTSGTYQVITTDELKKLLVQFIDFCEYGCTNNINGFQYDDRLTRFLQSRFIKEIKFFDIDTSIFRGDING